MSIESREQSSSYLSTKLLSIHNMNNWELYILEKLTIYLDIGQAIRKGVLFDPVRPTTNESSYLYRHDISRPFRSAIKTFNKLGRC